MQPNDVVLWFFVLGMLGTVIVAVIADWRKAHD